MALRKILTFPDPLLKETSTDVEEVNDEIREIIKDMYETMHESQGIGLAAPQIGILKNIIVVDIRQAEEGESEENSQITLVNPCIIEREGDISIEEGCLSVPDLLVKIKRSCDIVVTGLNEAGSMVEIKCDKLAAIVVQHEMDHLKGVLITDHASHLKRSLYTKKIKKKEKQKKL